MSPEDDDGDRELLLEFLYLMPIGVIRFRADGTIDLLNWPYSFGKIYSDQRSQNYVQQNPCVIKGNNAKKSARIKSFKIIGRIAGFQQNPSNQKTRENKKQIDSRPAQPEPIPAQKTDRTRARNRKIMADHDQ